MVRPTPVHRAKPATDTPAAGRVATIVAQVYNP
jgi:hypothetical protein